MATLEAIREYCLSFPLTKEDIPWKDTLTFKVEGKIFAIINLDYPHYLAIKCSDEDFGQRTEADHIVPAPYLARAKWIDIALEQHISTTELKEWINQSYLIITKKLPRRIQIKIMKAYTRVRGKQLLTEQQ